MKKLLLAVLIALFANASEIDLLKVATDGRVSGKSYVVAQNEAKNAKAGYFDYYTYYMSLYYHKPSYYYSQYSRYSSYNRYYRNPYSSYYRGTMLSYILANAYWRHIGR